MRLKHVKGAQEIINKGLYYIDNPKEYKGIWSKIFNNNNPIYIEIGMGKGDFIIENALTYPNINFIGIEKFDSVMVRAVQKLDETEIPNLKLIKMDELNIDDIFDYLNRSYQKLCKKYDIAFIEFNNVNFIDDRAIADKIIYSINKSIFKA